jgi:excisionase family DNA binding protein
MKSFAPDGLKQLARVLCPCRSSRVRRRLKFFPIPDHSHLRKEIVAMTRRGATPLASVFEVLTYLNVSESSIRRRITDGRLPATKIGNQIRIKWADVDALVAHNSIVPDDETPKR